MLDQDRLHKNLEKNLKEVFGTVMDSERLSKFCEAVARSVVEEVKNGTVNTQIGPQKVS